MYLSKVELGASAARSDRFWAEVSRADGAHRALWRLMSRSPEQRRDFLFRQDHGARWPTFLVLSERPPVSDDDGLWKIGTKPFAPRLEEGQRLGFLLTANPVVRRGAVEPTTGKRRVVRHDVVFDAARREPKTAEESRVTSRVVEAAGLRWLRDQADRSGFRLVEERAPEIGDDGMLLPGGQATTAVRIGGYRQVRVWRAGEKPMRFSTLDFEGVLEVADPARFLDRVRKGFGPQKAFGCGLMLLRRA